MRYTQIEQASSVCGSGVNMRGDIHAFPPLLAAGQPARLSRHAGAYVCQERIAYRDRSLVSPAAQATFASWPFPRKTSTLTATMAYGHLSWSAGVKKVRRYQS